MWHAVNLTFSGLIHRRLGFHQFCNDGAKVVLLAHEFCMYLRSHQVLPADEINLFNLLLNKLYLFRLLPCHQDLSNARTQRKDSSECYSQQSFVLFISTAADDFVQETEYRLVFISCEMILVGNESQEHMWIAIYMYIFFI